MPKTYQHKPSGSRTSKLDQIHKFMSDVQQMYGY